MSRTALASRLAASLAALGTVIACAEAPTSSPPEASASASSLAPQEAPAFSRGLSAQLIPGRFIVTLRSGASPAAVAREHGVTPDFVYDAALNGFAGSISDAARAGLLRDARVTRVEQDGIATTQSTETGATWGIDRVDQRSLPLSTTFTYTNTGAGVTAYIIDTGILFTHSEFGGRAVSGYDAVDGGSADDCNGHGTHVAGTVGGATYGVAKGVRLVAVRVLDCGGSGSWSGVIAGMNWVTKNHATPAVANMSLGGGASSSVDDALRGMIASGVATAVAAGNGNQGGRQQDACKYSPARVAEAMTIGATDRSDTKTSWSNYGNCVDWFAPGLSITSSWYSSNTATNTISGTSMATPHTTGVAALYLQTHGSSTAQQVRDALYASTTKGIVNKSYTANNHLLFTNY
ncbi:MAG TPA: S8 family serine peptidase [Gemmatimonadaceae bacterium]|nr:S8 family serine peptidase [Gemmatimonadaceae bacterium]